MLYLNKPFFGLLSKRSPLMELLGHYAIIKDGVSLISDSIECYIGGKQSCKEFGQLLDEVDTFEDKADKVKRTIRNHLPIGLLMPVDKTLFFNYTRSQDNILDEGQEALHWLAMRRVSIPDLFKSHLLAAVSESLDTVAKLQPALDATVNLLVSSRGSRKETKEFIRGVRAQHKSARQTCQEAVAAIYASDVDFKDIYQLMHFLQGLQSMSHNTEGCADLLRSMIAR